ncbi:MAG TPA: hypothetical protein VL401_03130 [Alphaproteobacteria bacterium]|jgi:hypothetical protein|nr:hypothetical protein [Alphaproteobacteria bacterium]
MKINKYKLAISFLVGVFSLIFISQKVLACDFATSPWFVSTVDIDKSKLPQGIQTKSEEKSYDESSKTIELLNITNTPIYLIRVDQYYKGTLAELKLENTFPRYKLENNKVYYYEFGSNSWVWKEKEYLRDKGVALDIGTIDDLTTWVTNGKDNIWNKSGDNRPVDIKIPEPETRTITYFKEGKAYELPVTVSYRLNKDYDPHSVEKGSKACGEFNQRMKQNYNLIEWFRNLITWFTTLIKPR